MREKVNVCNPLKQTIECVCGEEAKEGILNKGNILEGYNEGAINWHTCG